MFINPVIKYKARFMVYGGSMNAKRLLRFFAQLVKGAARKVFLILDNLRVHHARLVKAWLAAEENQRNIEVFFLPACLPELNPDEYLNCDLPAAGRRHRFEFATTLSITKLLMPLNTHCI